MGWIILGVLVLVVGRILGLQKYIFKNSLLGDYSTSSITQVVEIHPNGDWVAVKDRPEFNRSIKKIGSPEEMFPGFYERLELLRELRENSKEHKLLIGSKNMEISFSIQEEYDAKDGKTRIIVRIKRTRSKFRFRDSAKK